MVWQFRIPTIVIVTNLMEGQKVKETPIHILPCKHRSLQALEFYCDEKAIMVSCHLATVMECMITPVLLLAFFSAMLIHCGPHHLASVR